MLCHFFVAALSLGAAPPPAREIDAAPPPASIFFTKGMWLWSSGALGFSLRAWGSGALGLWGFDSLRLLVIHS